MSQRFDYTALSAPQFRKYLDFSNANRSSVIEPKIRDLMNIRVSQINGCAFCVDMHIKEAKLRGEAELRLHHLAIWHESPLFSVRERAALKWAEQLTLVAGKGVPDTTLTEVRDVFSDEEISALTFIAVTINGWNRLSIASGAVPGSADAVYGLTKVSFS